MGLVCVHHGQVNHLLHTAGWTNQVLMNSLQRESVKALSVSALFNPGFQSQVFPVRERLTNVTTLAPITLLTLGAISIVSSDRCRRMK